MPQVARGLYLVQKVEDPDEEGFPLTTQARKIAKALKEQDPKGNYRIVRIIENMEPKKKARKP